MITVQILILLLTVIAAVSVAALRLKKSRMTQAGAAKVLGARHPHSRKRRLYPRSAKAR
jgi:hypothetical protein